MIKKLFKICMIIVLMTQYFQPVAVLAERRIIIYENQTGPYYQVDVTGNEIMNTPEPEEENDIFIEETQEMEMLENQEESLVIPESTVEPEFEDEPESAEAPAETEQPVLTEDQIEQEETLELDVEEPLVPTSTPEGIVEPTEDLEIIETAPIEFKEVISEFVVEVEDGFVFEQAIDEYTSVYSSTEEDGLKQLVIGENPINAQVNQNFEQISLQLNENTASTYSLRNHTGWSNTNNTIQSSYPVDPADGITFTVRGRSLVLKSTLASAGEPVLQNNQIIYPMEGNVNLRYVIQPGLISEDIMIYSSEASSTYRYEVLFESGRIASSENVIAVIGENEELLMYITAPVAYDAAGAETEVTLTYEDGIMSVSIDDAWMKSEERVYPIVIDPEYSFSNISFNSSMAFDVSVGANQPNNTMGALDMANFNYILPAGMKNHAFLYLGNTSVLSDAHSFYKMKLDHPALSDVLAGKFIKDAYLRLSTGDDGRISKNNTIIAKLVKSNFNILQAKYSAMPQGLEVISETPIEAGNWKSYDIDITDYVRWYYSLGNQNNAVQLQLADQSGSATFHSFEYVCYDQKGWYTPLTIVNYVDGLKYEDTDINNSTITLRPFTEYDYETGKLQIKSLGFDGIAPKGSAVSVTVKKGSYTVYTKSMDVTHEYKYYPDHAGNSGTQGYSAYESNWQMDTYLTEFQAGQVYDVTYTISKSGQSVTKTTSFQIYEVKAFDVAGSVADYYGISEDQLMIDNNMTSNLIVKGNVMFIREPQKNKGSQYETEDLSEDVQKQVIAALRGADLICEYGLVPVNLNTGSYLVQSNDFSMNLFQEEFSFIRTYNSSAADNPGIFGYGWSFTGNYAVAEGDTGATVLLDDGTKYFFELTDGTYSSHLTKQYQLTKENGVFELECKDKIITFNAQGRPETITDRKGFETRYEYENSKLMKITMPNGVIVEFDYVDGKVSKLTLNGVDSIFYGYENKNLTSYTDQMGKTTKYVYDDNHNMISWINPKEETVVVNEYDNRHRLLKQTDADGKITTLSYSERQTAITDPSGQVKTVTLDDKGYTSAVVYPGGTSEAKKFENGLLIEQTLENGVQYKYTYDEYGNLKTSSNETDGVLTTYEYENKYDLLSEVITDSLGNELKKESWRYHDGSHDVASHTDAAGRVTTYTYYDNHLKKTETDPAGNTTTYEYDPHGNITKVIYPDSKTKEYKYNSFGYMTEQKDEHGNITKHTLNDRNQIESILYPDGSSESYAFDDAGNVVEKINVYGGTTRYTYDENGNLTSEIDVIVNEDDTEDLSRVTEYTYDSNGNLLEKKLANGLITRYEYDSRNRLLKETIVNDENDPDDDAVTSYSYNQYGISAITNVYGKTKTNQYNGSGYLEKITDFDENAISYEYDLLGRVKTETSKTGVVTSYEYNGAGQITKTVVYSVYDDQNPATNVIRSETEISYDLKGNVDKRTVYVERTTREWDYSYDFRGNLVEVIDPLGNKTSYEYSVDRLVKMTDALNRVTSYEYDSMGNVKKMTYHDGTVVSNFKDPKNKIATETDGNANTTTYHYNEHGDLIRKIDAKNNTISYEYDEMAQIIKEIEPNNVVREYGYDDHGNLIEEKLSGKTIKQFIYDSKLQTLIEEKVYGVTTVRYEYDDFGQIEFKKEKTFDATQDLITQYVPDENYRIKEVKVNGVLWENNDYDVFDQLTSKTNQYGLTTSYVYYDDGTLKTMTVGGLIENYTVDLNGQMTRMEDSLGNIVEYEYDPVGNLIKKTVNGNSTTYEVDAFNRVIKEIDSLGKITQWEYDGNGNLIKEINGAGNIKRYVYDQLNQLVFEYAQDSAQAQEQLVVEYVYDANGRMIRKIQGENIGLTDEEDEDEEFIYDVWNRVSSYVNERGYETKYFYDEHDNVKEIKVYMSQTDFLGITVQSFEYNDFNQLTSETDGEGNTTEYKYDIFGNVSKIIDAKGNEESFEYNSKNQLVKETAKNGLITQITYNQYNLPLTITQTGVLNAEVGQTTTITKQNNTYDNYGRLIRSLDALGLETTYEYDTLDNLIEETRILSEEHVYLIQYEYNSENQRSKMIQYSEDSTEAQITEYGYDGAGRLNSTTRYGTDTLEVSKRTSTALYDARDNVVAETDPLGNITSYQFDKNNRLIKITDGSGRITENEYDPTGNLVSVTVGNQSRTEYVYDALNRQIAEKDAYGNQTTYIYDDASRLVRVQDAKGYWNEYVRDELGNIIFKISNPDDTNQQQVHYIYDEVGRIYEITDIDNRTERFRYDSFGNQVTMIQKDGLLSTYEYDFAGNKTKENNVTFKYDKLSRLTNVQNGTVTTSFEYDAFGNLVLSNDVDYEYNEFNEKIRVTYPDETQQSFVYDKAGRLSSTTANGLTVVSTYDGAGRNLTETYSNGLLVTKTYDAAGNLATQKTEKNGTVLSRYTYGYDGNNSLISETRILDGVTETLTHEYNERDELIKTTSTKNGVTTVIEYVISMTGNHVVMIDGITDSNSDYNDLNQLKKYTSEDGTETRYDYDIRGNRKKETRDSQEKLYEFDEFNRLVKVTDYDGTVINYSYDGLGNRVSEKITSNNGITTITYVNDYTQDVVEVLSKTTETVKENYYYGNERISSSDTIYVYDGLANVNMTLSLTGSIQKKYEYSDYGQRSLDSKTEIINNGFGYNGEAHTVDGLQYLRSRYYDPVTGVFISADSYRGEFSNPLSQNRYTYCHNNPYKYDDPTGHLPNIKDQTGRKALIYDVEAASQSTALPPLTNRTASSVPTQEYRATSIDEAHAKNQQNAFTGSLTLLGSTNKAPVKEPIVAKEETEVTGEHETKETGTVSVIVTEPHDNTQPYGVESYEIQTTETKVIDVKDITKAIISGAVMAGIGMAVMGLFAAASIAAPIAAVAAAAVSGFAQTFVDANVGALVENKSLEEYGKSQGYETLAEYQNKLFHDAAIGAVVGAVLSAALIFGPGLIKNSISKMVGQEAAEHVDETLVILSESSDEIGQKGNELSKIAPEKVKEVTSEATEKSAKTVQQVVDESGKPTKTLYRGDKPSIVPKDVFENGFSPKGTHNDALLHTKSNTTAGNFVSTSSDISIATEFGGKNGYVYVIQTDNYIDINAAYGVNAYFPEQMEYSIPGGIKPIEIVGAFKKRDGNIVGDLILNPNFGGY